MARPVCTCGHPVNAHTEYGMVARPNGPTTNRACKLCACWRPVIRPAY